MGLRHKLRKLEALLHEDPPTEEVAFLEALPPPLVARSFLHAVHEQMRLSPEQVEGVGDGRLVERAGWNPARAPSGSEEETPPGCEDVPEDLTPYLAEDLPPRWEVGVTDHLLGCEGCREAAWDLLDGYPAG